MITSLMAGFGLTGMFASRVFLPMFAAALMLRFGPEFGLTDDMGLLGMAGIGTAPTWFTQNSTILILAVLAAAEVGANKSPEARQLLAFVDQYAKPIAAMLTYAGYISLSDTALVERTLDQAAGFVDIIIGAFIAAGTFVAATLRNAVFLDISEADEDDDTGIQGLFSWAEDIWSVFGIFFLILFPLVMIVLIALVIGILYLLRKRAEAKEEKSKVPCPSCEQPMYRSAMQCANCKNPNPQPTRINWLGASTKEPTPDPATHPLLLVAKKRCSVCATRLEKRTPAQQCPACQTPAFVDAGFLQRYDAMVSSRLPATIAVCALLSLIPVIGLIPGVIVYRIKLVGPYRRYVPRGRAMALRLGIKIFFLVLIAMQWIPGLGAITVPLMAATSYGLYRGSFMGLTDVKQA